MKKLILGIIIGLSLGCVGIYAAYIYSAREISYKNTNVEDAINDLYTKANTKNHVFRIYSAPNDTIYYYNGSNKENLCMTNLTGEGVCSLPVGNYTLYSTVAKNPNNLSSDYSKSINISNDKDQYYLMPEGKIIYWYGYNSNNVTITRDTNAGTATKNINNISISHYIGTSGNALNVFENSLIDVTNYNSAKIITKYSDTSSYIQDLMIRPDAPTLRGFDYSISVRITPSNELKTTSLDISNYSGNYYVNYLTNEYPNMSYIYAMWLE